jgi:hypothetical protein
MANLVIRRSDLYPVGTLVYAYAARNAVPGGGKPSGTALSSATVAADGSLTFVGISERTAVVLWAEVAPGVHVTVKSESPPPVMPLESLRERIRNRRLSLGLTLGT